MIPFVQTAQAAVDPSFVSSIVNPIIVNIVEPIVGIVFIIAMLVFIYGVVEMIAKAGDADAREKGRNHMLYGAIGATIMVSAWGIIYFIADTVHSF